MNVAQRCRLEKEAHPERYCPKCLWKTGGGFCPRHAPKEEVSRPRVFTNGKAMK